ncbi:hypothetical protein B0H15DRAFT_996447 [Mycena belliarum]|uniref:Uncharacterized protein n=1 Tax=Mycena belliarum TaxID=1033014 RepID=A0AAD6TV76_9AGAR|nr:hypothetical protein B0H15DRAFT_996447 [Mycena belliae]
MAASWQLTSGVVGLAAVLVTTRRRGGAALAVFLSPPLPSDIQQASARDSVFSSAQNESCLCRILACMHNGVLSRDSWRGEPCTFAPRVACAYSWCLMSAYTASTTELVSARSTPISASESRPQVPAAWRMSPATRVPRSTLALAGLAHTTDGRRRTSAAPLAPRAACLQSAAAPAASASAYASNLSPLHTRSAHDPTPEERVFAAPVPDTSQRALAPYPLALRASLPLGRCKSTAAVRALSESASTHARPFTNLRRKLPADVYVAPRLSSSRARSSCRQDLPSTMVSRRPHALAALNTQSRADCRASPVQRRPADSCGACLGPSALQVVSRRARGPPRMRLPARRGQSCKLCKYPRERRASPACPSCSERGTFLAQRGRVKVDAGIFGASCIPPPPPHRQRARRALRRVGGTRALRPRACNRGRDDTSSDPDGEPGLLLTCRRNPEYTGACHYKATTRTTTLPRAHHCRPRVPAPPLPPPQTPPHLEHRDLVSLALVSRAAAAPVIPRHTEYRVVRTRHLHLLPAMWAHLARRANLTRNIRKYSEMLMEFKCLADCEFPDRHARLPVDKKLDIYQLDPATLFELKNLQGGSVRQVKLHAFRELAALNELAELFANLIWLSMPSRYAHFSPLRSLGTVILNIGRGRDPWLTWWCYARRRRRSSNAARRAHAISRRWRPVCVGPVGAGAAHSA